MTVTATALSTRSAAELAAATVGRLRRARWSLGVFAAGLIASFGLYHAWWRDPAHTTLGRAHTDPMQAMWNLTWVPWALLHGHNPLHSDAIFYPHGVALSWNTLTPTLGVAAAPLTLTVGATVTYAILMTLSPALAVLTSFWWLRRHVSRPLAAAVGGFVVAFSPFMAGHLKGHLDLTFIALIPLQLLLVEDLLWRRPRTQRRTAIMLGVVTALQAGINEELVLITAAAIAVALVGAAVLGGRDTRQRLKESVRGAVGPLALSIAVFAVIASPLLIDQLFMSPDVGLHAAIWRALPADYVSPTPSQQFWFNAHHTSQIFGAEDGVYVGWVLLPILIAGVLITSRDRRVRVAALTLAAMVLLTFGDAHPLGIPLPWQFLENQPLLQSVLPSRFAFGSWLAIAWLLTVWLDALGARLVHGPGTRRAVAAVAVAMIGVGLLSLLPRAIPSFPVRHLPRPLTASRIGVPTGSPVLLLPSPTPWDANGMYTQMQARFSYRIPGGYALRPHPGGGSSSFPPDSPVVDIAAATTWTPDQLAAASAQLATQHYRAIVVLDGRPDTPRLMRLARALTGHAPDLLTDDAAIWHLPTP